MKKSEPPHAWVTARMCPERSESVVPSQVAPKYNEASHAGPRQKSSSNVVAGKRATIVYNRQKTHAVTNIRLLFGVFFCKNMNAQSAQRLLCISFTPVERHHDVIVESTLQHKVICFFIAGARLLILHSAPPSRDVCIRRQGRVTRLRDWTSRRSSLPHLLRGRRQQTNRNCALKSPEHQFVVHALLHIKAEIAYRIARTDIFDDFTCPGDVIRNASL